MKIKARYENDTVLDILRRCGAHIVADCGGNGTCGRCKVKFTDKDACPAPSEADIALLSEREIAGDVRLACTSHINEETEITIPDSSITTEIPDYDKDERNGLVEPLGPSEIIAVDYGSTIISGELVDLNSGVVREASTINHQNSYGADIISRIKAANSGYGEELRHVSISDLAELSTRLGIDPEKARYIISANTTMGHLISGFSCKGLGEYPYTPVDISLRRDGNMTFLPGISAFVGADIVSGVCASSLDISDKPWLYADVGTNGEMAIGVGKDVIVASAPAGPAFEGAGITCGVPRVPGAIERCVITGNKAIPVTVGDMKAIGICGTGVIEMTAGLLKNRIIDETGTLPDEYSGQGTGDGFPITGDIVFTQDDIRSVQKAKAAVRTGIETLIKEAGIERNDIEKLVIAGSFGYGLDMEKAAAIGLLPPDMIGRTATCGNASLRGATLYALDTGFGDRLKALSEHAREIVLTDAEGFDSEYISRLDFPCD